MLISHKNKFVKIDIPKTGTSSFRKTLEPLRVINIVGQPHWDIFYQHGNIENCKKGFQDRSLNIDNYFKYTMVRNPWSRYVSFLMYKLSRAKRYESAKKEDMEKWSGPDIRQCKLCFNQLQNFGWDENKLLKNIIENNVTQRSFVFDGKNNFSMDRIGCFEDFNKEFDLFCEKVGILNPPKLEHANKSSYNKSYKDYYNQELIDIVAEKEKWVINYKNYDF